MIQFHDIDKVATFKCLSVELSETLIWGAHTVLLRGVLPGSFNPDFPDQALDCSKSQINSHPADKMYSNKLIYFMHWKGT